MTPQEQEWLESEFKKIHLGIAAILGKVGLVDADVRGFRDMMIKAQGNPKLSGADLYNEYVKQFEGYCQMIDMEPERAASHVRGLFDSVPHNPNEPPQKSPL